MNNFDFDVYDYEDIKPTAPSPTKKVETKQTNNKSASSFDFDAYDPSSLQESTPDAENEGLFKTALRYVNQIPKGLAQATGPGIVTNLMSAVATGESLSELDELEERLPELKKKFPQFQFPDKIDREKYMEALQQASSTFPTVSNIASGIEEKTGIPLEARTRGQKFVEFASSAGKLSPKGYTLQGMNTSLPRPALGLAVAGTKEALVEGGVPEPIADLASFFILKKPTAGAGKISVETKTKPSGMKERFVESVDNPRDVSINKMNKINEAIEKDFRGISEKIIEESPVGEVAKNLKNDSTFKQQSRELLDEAQKVADTIPETMHSDVLKQEILAQGKKQQKGYAPSEYDKNYINFVKDRFEDLPKGEIKAGQAIENYRKNNDSLREYFERGSSDARNRAKRDVILDENRALVNALEKTYPDSPLVPVLRAGNERWTKIMDAEFIDEFTGKIFDKKLNFKEAQAIFDDPNTNRIFQRALGKDGYAKFEQLTKDLLTNEKGYKNLKIAEKLGLDDLAKTASFYVLHPTVGAANTGRKLAMQSYKFLLNALLDKPKLTFKWDRANNALKAGDFKTAEKLYKALDSEVEVLNRPTAKSSKPAETTIDAKVTPVSEKAPEQARIEYKEKPKAQPKPKVERSELEAEKKALKEQRREVRDKWVEETDESKIAELDTKLEKIDRELFEIEKKIRKEPKAETTKEESKSVESPSKKLDEPKKIEKKIEKELKESTSEEAKPHQENIKKTDRLEEYIEQTKADQRIKEIRSDIKEAENYIVNLNKKIKDIDLNLKKEGTSKSNKKLLEKERSNQWDDHIYWTRRLEKLKNLENVHRAEQEIRDSIIRKRIQEMLKKEASLDKKNKAKLTSEGFPKPEKKDITITLRNGTKKQYNGDVYEDIFGVLKMGDYWQVSHLPTSGQIANFKTMAKAKEFVRQIYKRNLFDKKLIKTKEFEEAGAAFDRNGLMDLRREIENQ